MARFIDDRGRLFGKISVVDILVLVAVVALALFLGLRSTGDEVGTLEGEPVKITFSVQPADPRMIEGYTALGPLKDISGRTIGTIERAEVSELPPVQFSGKSWEFDLSFPIAPDVIIEVAAEANIFDGEVHVGPLAARVGAAVELIGPGWEGWGLIVGVEQGAAATE